VRSSNLGPLAAWEGPRLRLTILESMSLEVRRGDARIEHGDSGQSGTVARAPVGGVSGIGTTDQYPIVRGSCTVPAAPA